MDLVVFEEDCRLLGEALRTRGVPREHRREARELLKRAFLLRGEPEMSPEPAALAELSVLGADIDGLLLAIGAKKAPDPYEPLAFKLARMWPVQIRFAVRQSWLDRFEVTYFRLGDRLDRVVDWFWTRCKPDDEVGRERTVAERALDEFAGEEREFVWGRKRRPPPE